jgi:hypothetical protein
MNELLETLEELFQTQAFMIIGILLLAFAIKWAFISLIIKGAVKDAIKEAWNEQIRLNIYDDTHNVHTP